MVTKAELNVAKACTLCPQDSISQKSLDIQARAEDQQSIGSVEKMSLDTRRQSQFSVGSGPYEDGPRARTPTSE